MKNIPSFSLKYVNFIVYFVYNIIMNMNLFLEVCPFCKCDKCGQKGDTSKCNKVVLKTIKRKIKKNELDEIEQKYGKIIGFQPEQIFKYEYNCPKCKSKKIIIKGENKSI